MSRKISLTPEYMLGQIRIHRHSFNRGRQLDVLAEDNYITLSEDQRRLTWCYFFFDCLDEEIVRAQLQAKGLADASDEVLLEYFLSNERTRHWLNHPDGWNAFKTTAIRLFTTSRSIIGPGVFYVPEETLEKIGMSYDHSGWSSAYKKDAALMEAISAWKAKHGYTGRTPHKTPKQATAPAAATGPKAPMWSDDEEERKLTVEEIAKIHDMCPEIKKGVFTRTIVIDDLGKYLSEKCLNTKGRDMDKIKKFGKKFKFCVDNNIDLVDAWDSLSQLVVATWYPTNKTMSLKDITKQVDKELANELKQLDETIKYTAGLYA